MTFQQEIYNKRFEEKGCFLPLNEEWKLIGLINKNYQISNYGRARSLKRKVIRGGRIHNLKGNILKNDVSEKGYCRIKRCIKSKITRELTHRCVLRAFVENKYNKKEVNHLDEVPSNNFLWNLEWATRKENNNYGTRTKKTSKKINQLTTDGNFVKQWNSTREADRNGYNSGVISQCCLNRKGYYTHKGYKWEFA